MDDRLPEAPQQLGSYEIVGLIGTGGMGEVYRARDPRIGREVAIKRLPDSFGADPDRLRRFEREARLAGSLNHPNLVTIHDAGTHDGAPFVVMELLHGETLRSELSRRPGVLPVRKAVDYAVQIAKGLAAAHEQNVVHRDLKPENIFITSDGLVKILDFGLAKTVRAPKESTTTLTTPMGQAETGEGIVLGTASYMSPEQVNGEAAGARSDIFSFGVVLFEMLSGKRLFKRESAIETMHAIVADDPPELNRLQPSVPVYLDRIVRRCLEKKPAARFQSARDVAYALEAVASTSESIVAVRKRTLPAGWVVIVAAIAIGLGAAAWLATRRSTKPITFERITFRRGNITAARFAPDGRTVVFSAAWDGGPSRIYVKRPEGTEIVPLDLPPSLLLSVSRTGELAILLEPRVTLPFEPDLGTLARVSMNGGAPRRLLENVLSADWSSDGSRLAVIRDTGRDHRLELRSADGAELVRELYATSSGSLGSARFSPAGDRIAFIAHPIRLGGTGSVMVMKINGTNPKSIGTAEAYTEISWSADGEEIWFAQGSVVRTDIVAATDSGKTRTIFQSPDHVGFNDSSGSRVLIVGSDIAARAACSGGDAGSERDISWKAWNLPVQMTNDARQVLLHGRSGRLDAARIGLQPLDGSPITDLGLGSALSFAADERSVLALLGPHELAFIPIGTGERVTLPPLSLDRIAGGSATPDGKSIVVTGVSANVTHLYVMTADGRDLRRISDEPIYFPFISISPDSRSVAAIGPTYRMTVYEIASGKATVVPTSVPGDYPIRFAGDGSLLYNRTHPSGLVYRFDFGTQRETLVREVAPADRAGVLWAYPRAMTSDGNCYCYQYAQILSKLFIADGLVK